MPAATYPSGYSSASLTPTIAIQVNLGSGSRSAGNAPKKLLILANKIESAISRTVGSTTYTTAAGTLATMTPTAVYGLDDVRARAGAGSRALRAAKAVYAQKKNANLWLCLVPEASGATAATATLEFAGTATAAGECKTVVAGDAATISVAVGDTPETIAKNVAHALNKITDAVVTATAAIDGAGPNWITTITAKNKGNQGENLTVRCSLSSAGTTVELNASGGGSLSVAGNLAAGTLDVDLTDSLAACATMKFDRIAADVDDSTNLSLLRAHVNTVSSPAEKKRGQAVAGFVGTDTAVKTMAESLNSPRVQLAWLYKADALPGQIAAAVAAARLWGDGLVGGGIGKSRGEEAYPAANLNATILGDIKEQASVSDQPTGAKIDACIAAGVTPLAPSAAYPGYVQIVKSVTTASKDGAGNPSYKVHDTSKVTVSDHLADLVESRVAAEFPNKNIGEDPGDGSAPTHPDVIYLSHIESFLAQLLFEQQTAGNVVKVAENLADLVVEQDPENPSNVLVSIPENVIPHFHGLFGSLNQNG